MDKNSIHIFNMLHKNNFRFIVTDEYAISQ